MNIKNGGLFAWICVLPNSTLSNLYIKCSFNYADLDGYTHFNFDELWDELNSRNSSYKPKVFLI
jgi:hypothetical protein